MGSKLKKLKTKIFFGDHSDAEWIEINEKVQSELKKASEAEKQEFVDSGAGNLLAQVIEYM